MGKSRFGIFLVTTVLAAGACKSEKDSTHGGGGGTAAKSSAAPVAGTLRMQLQPKDGAPAESVSGAMVSVVDHPEISAVADEQGRVDVDGLLPGVLSILVTSEDGAAAGLADASASYGLKVDGVLIKAGEVQDLGERKLQATGSITGAVKFYQNDRLDLSGSDVYVPGTSILAKTGDTGLFTLAGLPPGTYPLYAQHEGFAILKLAEVVVEEEKVTDLGDLLLSLSDGPEGSITIKADKSRTVGNDVAKVATTRNVNLALDYDADSALMKISDEPTFLNKKWQPAAKTATWQFDSDGEYTIYVMYSDLNGLESSPYADRVFIDTENPTITSAKLTYNWSETSGRINFAALAAADSGSGVAEVLVAVDDAEFTGATWQPFAEEIDVDIGAAAGLKTVYFKVRDHAGRESSMISDTITKTAYTMIPAIVDHDTRLRKAQSPFKIVGDTQVNGALYVEAGVVLEFDQNTDGAGDADSKLIVDGPLVVAGKSTSPVVFIADQDSPSACKHEIDLTKQTNDDISASKYESLTLQDLCMFRIKGGTMDHLKIVNGYDLNAGSTGIITKTGPELLTIRDAEATTLTTASFVEIEPSGGTIRVIRANVSGVTNAPVFRSHPSSTLVIEESTFSGGTALVEGQANGSGTVSVTGCTVTGVDVFAQETGALTATRNDIVTEKLHMAFNQVDNVATYTRNDIELVGANADANIADLLFLAGGRDHTITLANNNITCSTANNCRGGIETDLKMLPNSIDVTFTDNHWVDKAPIASTDVATCGGGSTSFIVCLDGGSGQSANLDLGIGAYEYDATHTNTPSAIWSGLSGNFSANASLNVPSGRP